MVDLLAGYAALTAALSCGAMLFFSFVVAPLVFIKLPPETAAKFIRELFPVYYVVLGGMTAIAALLAWDRWQAAVLWLVAVLFLAGRLLLLPALDKARQGRPAEYDVPHSARFRHLHRLSVAINAIQMVLLAAAALTLAGWSA